MRVKLATNVFVYSEQCACGCVNFGNNVSYTIVFRIVPELSY